MIALVRERRKKPAQDAGERDATVVDLVFGRAGVAQDKALPAAAAGIAGR